MAPLGLVAARHLHNAGVDVTVVLALPKIGLRGAASVGDLFVADISVPSSVYNDMDAGPAPDFGRNAIVAVR